MRSFPSIAANFPRRSIAWHLLFGGLGLIGTLLFLIGMVKFPVAIILAVLIIAAVLGLFVLARELRPSAQRAALHQI
jgi:hypothetical protein